MNKMIISTLLLGLSIPLMANCGNGPNDGGNGCNGNTGPQGPQGPAGNNGSNGVNGTNGTNGTNGSNGVNGAIGAQGPQGPGHVDPRMNEARLGLDTSLRLWDGKHTQVSLYNIYSPDLHDKEDVVGDGRNLQFGVRFVIKLGRSYEEELLEKQAVQIKALEAMVGRMAQ